MSSHNNLPKLTSIAAASLIEADDSGVAVASPPPIDRNVVFARCMGDRSMALWFLAEIETAVSAEVEAITTYFQNGDFASAAEVAHTLKGAAAIAGAPLISRLAARIESAAHVADVSQLALLVPQLREEMQRCLALVATIRTDCETSSELQWIKNTP